MLTVQLKIYNKDGNQTLNSIVVLAENGEPFTVQLRHSLTHVQYTY
jgi:hypothetical protein